MLRTRKQNLVLYFKRFLIISTVRSTDMDVSKSYAITNHKLSSLYAEQARYVIIKFRSFQTPHGFYNQSV